jgi:hypothetical protein
MKIGLRKVPGRSFKLGPALRVLRPILDDRKFACVGFHVRLWASWKNASELLATADAQRKAVEEIRSSPWDLYNDLKAHKTAPDPALAGAGTTRHTTAQ